MIRGDAMKRRLNRPSRADTTVIRPRRPKATAVGVFTGTTVAALLATWPFNVTVSLNPEPDTVVVGQADAQHPVRQAALTLAQTSSGGTPMQRAGN